MKKLLLTLGLLPLMFAGKAYAQEQEQPILTIACLSDVHSMNSMITPSSGKMEDIRPRSSFINTIAALKEQENIDVLVMGGDYISDKTFAQANFEQHRTVLASKAREAFQAGKSPYAIYINGNHEYEVANFDALPKTWNAGDYYTGIMQTDLGELSADECFYEMAPNGSSPQMKLLTAFHYKLYGYDFVVMNTGKYFFASAWDYQVSAESVDWVDKKLDEIYKDDPDKLVFFLMHVPFYDSNSLNSGKGLTDNTTSKALKKALAKHHNVVMIYGHDHGGDNAFTRRLTSQRVTLYDDNGNVLPTTDERHIDGKTIPEEDVTQPNEQGEVRCGEFYLYNDTAKKYLIFDGSYFALSATESALRVGAFNNGFAINYSPSARPFSVNYLSYSASNMFSSGSKRAFKLYRVTNPGAKLPHAVPAKGIKSGESYVVVDSASSYAMSGSVYGTGKMNRIQVIQHEDSLEFKYPVSAKKLVWTFKSPTDVKDEPDPEGRVAQGNFTMWNEYAGKYINVDANNISLDDNPITTTYKITNGVANISMSYGGTSYGLHIGSNGYFSRGTASELMLFRVINPEEATPKAVRATRVKAGEVYLVVGLYDTKYYAMSGSLYSAGSSSQRMSRVEVEVSGDTIKYLYPASANRIQWTLKEVGTKPVVTTNASFMSLFMGSMRYYYNSIDFNDPSDSPQVVQALLVYVYNDRVVFNIKNYKDTGIINGMPIVEHPASYTLVMDKKDGVQDLGNNNIVKNNGTYDLAGRRVAGTQQKGMYISNNKKILVP